MSSTVVVTRPNHDFPTRYLAAWAHAVIQVASGRGHRVADLDGERARKTEFESVLKKTKPDLVFLNGHGGEDRVTGQGNEILVQAQENAVVLERCVIYALACSSAKTLGPTAVYAGAKAYVGYDDEFIFMYESRRRARPHDDKTAALFLEPSNQIPLSLIEGTTVARAAASAKSAFRKNIRELLTSETKPEESSVLRFLVWDLQHLAVAGDPGSRIA